MKLILRITPLLTAKTVEITLATIIYHQSRITTNISKV